MRGRKSTLRDDRIANLKAMSQQAVQFGGEKIAGRKFLEEAASHIGPLRGKYKSPEHDAQVAVIDWWRMQHKVYNYPRKIPEFLLLAVPNGSVRDKITAVRLKAEGVRSGVLDLFLAVPRGMCHGLWIEMKHGNNDLTENQSAFTEAVRDMGYGAICCWSSEEAIGAIKKYLTTGTI